MLIKIKEKILATNPGTLAKILQKILLAEDENDQKKEHFWSVGLSARNSIEYLELVSLGTLNANMIHPRELFRLAILKSVASIIVLHNHPSGALEPSAEDLGVTRRLEEAGRILGIRVIDHIIITKNSFYSFKENKLID